LQQARFAKPFRMVLNVLSERLVNNSFSEETVSI
jgi:hypothetical protein